MKNCRLYYILPVNSPSFRSVVYYSSIKSGAGLNRVANLGPLTRVDAFESTQAHVCAPLPPPHQVVYRGEQNRKEEVEDEKALPGAVSGLCTGYHETTEPLRCLSLLYRLRRLQRE